MLLGVTEINPGGPEGHVCAPGPFQFSPGKVHQLCDAFKFWSLHAGGSHFMRADKLGAFLQLFGGVGAAGPGDSQRRRAGDVAGLRAASISVCRGNPTMSATDHPARRSAASPGRQSPLR